MRRVVDLVTGLSCLVLLSPMLLLVAVLIRMDSKGPILYTPQMIGQHGKPFSLFRFRTMSSGQLTRVGRFLRHLSLDHLPMLLNLLKGDLTLVGPRPMEIHVADSSDPIWQRYFQVKPGVLNYAVLKLGKLWNMSRANNPALNQELELEYLEKRSPEFDVRLFLHAIRAWIKSNGNIKARGEPDADVNDRIHKVS